MFSNIACVILEGIHYKTTVHCVRAFMECINHVSIL